MACDAQTALSLKKCRLSLLRSGSSRAMRLKPSRVRDDIDSVGFLGGTLSRLVALGVLALAVAGAGSAWYWTGQHRAAHTAAQEQREATAATAAYEAQQRALITRLHALPLGPAFTAATSYLSHDEVCAPGGITVGCWDTPLTPVVASHEIAAALSRAGLGSPTVHCDSRPYCRVQIHNATANSISYRLIKHASTTNVWALATR